MRSLLALLLLSSAAFAGEPVTVRNNGGGETEVFEAQATAWAKAGTQVRLVGYCASACTIYAMARYKLNICATPGARLQFHMPYNLMASAGGWVKDTGPKAVQASKNYWANQWLGKFSPKLNAVLAKATRDGVIPNPVTETGGSRFYSVKAAEFMPACD